MLLITAYPEVPQIDTLPVFKTTYYPWNTGSYKPLAYARLAAVGSSFLLADLLSFERDPECSFSKLLDNACLVISLGEDTHDNRVLSIVVCADGRYQVYEDARQLPNKLNISRYAGDDEQGWYWGARLQIPFEWIWSNRNTNEIQSDRLLVNVYTYKQNEPGERLGSIAPVSEKDIFSVLNLELFKIINY